MTTLSKKLCLLGDFAVGKTSLVRRFVYSIYEDKYISTIGVKVSRKVVAIPTGGDVVELVMMLWDLAGGNEFESVRTSYLRGAAGGVLVCDVTRPETLAGIQGYADALLAISPGSRIVLAANKCDLTSEQCISEAMVAETAARLHAPYILTSAKTGVEVEALFRRLGHMLAS